MIQWPAGEVISDNGKWKSEYEPVIEPEPAKPTKLLADIEADARGIPYAEWKARELNQIFDEHGCPGQNRTSSNITAAIVADGREKQARRERRR